MLEIIQRLMRFYSDNVTGNKYFKKSETHWAYFCFLRHVKI